jgi:hypothetical protein
MSQSNSTSEVKKRKPKGHVAWRKLGEGIDPAFSTPYFLYGKDSGKEDEYSLGILELVKENAEGTTYYWSVNGYENPLNHFTHYAPCTTPVE